MAIRYVTQDVYDQIADLTKQKGINAAATVKGDTATADQAHAAADASRNWLTSYGYGDIVDDFAHKDYTGAKATLANYAVAPATGSGSSAGGTTSGGTTGNGNYSVGSSSPMAKASKTAAGIIKGMLGGKSSVDGTTSGNNNVTAPAASGSTVPATVNNGGIAPGAGALAGAYDIGSDAKTALKQRTAASAEYDRRKAAGQDPSGLATATQDYIVGNMSDADRAVTDHMDAEGKQRYIDAVYIDSPTETFDRNNKAMRSEGQTSMDFYRGMYDPSYGQNIRDYYNVYGQAVGTQAAQGTAAENGGNLDSFSQYNRAVTDLSYRNAAQRAIQAERDGYAQGWATMYTPWASSLNQGATAYGDYVNTANKLIADYDIALKQIESGERQANVAAELQKYGYDQQAAAQMAQLEADQAKAELEAAIQREQIKSNEAIAYKGYDAQIRTAEIGAGKTGSSGGGNGSGGDGSGSGVGNDDAVESNGTFDRMLAEGVTPERAYSYLIDAGNSATAAERLADDYEDVYNDYQDAIKAENIKKKQAEAGQIASNSGVYYESQIKRKLGADRVAELGQYAQNLTDMYNRGDIDQDGVVASIANDKSLDTTEKNYVYYLLSK